MGRPRPGDDVADRALLVHRSRLVRLTNDLHRDRLGSSFDLEICHKVNPRAVVYLGLGWERVNRLPGLAGLYLLDAEQARAAWPGVESAIGLEGSEVDRVMTTMGLWRETGDCPDLDSEHVFSMVPSIHCYANENDLGVVSIETTVG